MSIENNELIMSALDKIVKIRQKPGNDKIISEVLPDFFNLVFIFHFVLALNIIKTYEEKTYYISTSIC